jgi:hypothetical protein
MCCLEHLLSWHYMAASSQMLTQTCKHLMLHTKKFHMFVIIAAASETSLVPTDSVLKTLDFFLVLADATHRLCYELNIQGTF